MLDAARPRRGSEGSLVGGELCGGEEQRSGLVAELDDELTRGTAAWIASCQTYEGGIGATPGEEAHGGYTFCGLAAMVLLDAVAMRARRLGHRAWRPLQS